MEQERISRELMYMRGLALSFANQALVYCWNENKKRATRHAKEAYAIMLENGYADLEGRFRTIVEQVEGMPD